MSVAPSSPCIASVVIPAYNEERTIERCLETLLADARPGELEVIVACNGCRDRTAELARRFEDRGVRVVETQQASKSVALNLGDSHASCFPRFYLDADIRLTMSALREVVDLLETHPEVALSAPRAVVDTSQSDPLVRSYYRVWTDLPYFKENMIGSGVYAFSEEGRRRFDEFPEIIADDEFARRIVKPEERRSSSGETFVISAPRSIQSLLSVNTRVRAGMYQLEERFPELNDNRGTDPGRTLRIIAKSPRLWPDAPVYLGVMFLAKLLAHRKLKGKRAMAWNRDETARTQS